jgi:uncharacterized protein
MARDARTARPRALVTGASSGIGAALAEVFAAKGFDLIVTARREDRLATLAAALRDRHGAEAAVIPADLSTSGAVAALCDELSSRGLVVDTLINSAGFGVPGGYDRTSWVSQAALIQVTITSMAELTHRLLPRMLEQGDGRILNIASLAGLLPAPAGHTLYAASKAAVIRFSEALSEEVGDRGVHVTVLCPGFTLTEFHEVTGTRHLVDRLPGFMWSKAADVAAHGYDAVVQGRTVCIPGRLNRGIAFVGRHMPGAFALLQRRWSWSFRKV